MRNYLILLAIALNLTLIACSDTPNDDQYMLGEWRATVTSTATCEPLEPFEARLMVYEDPTTGDVTVDELAWEETSLTTIIDGRYLYVEAALGPPGGIRSELALSFVDIGNGAVDGEGTITLYTLSRPDGCTQALSAFGLHTYLE